MLGAIKISARDSIIYGIGNVAVKLVGLVLIPLYTDPVYFSTDDFGILGILEISGLVLTAFLASSLPQSMTRWYWDKEFRDQQKSVFFMSFVTQLAISALFITVLLPLSGSFSKILFETKDWGSVITLVIIASSLQAVNNIVNTLMRLQSRAFLYITTNILKLILVLILTIYFIVFRKMGFEGIYLAQVIGNGLFIIVLAPYIKQNSEFKFNWIIFKDMQSYGYPLLIANISAVALNVIDRYSLNSLTILKYVAVYTLAFKVTSVLKLVIVDSVKLALSPIMIRKMNDADNKRFYSKVLLYTSFVIMIGIVFLSLFSLEIVTVLDRSENLMTASALVPILSLSVFFMNLKEINVYGLHIVKKTNVISAVVVLTTILSLLLNILFINLWDATGCALATLVSQAVYWFAIFYYSQKYFYIKFEYRKLIIILLIGSLISFTPLLINEFSLFIRITIKLVLFTIFPAILYLLNFYDEPEKKAIAGFFKKWTNIRSLKSNLRSLKDIKEDFDQSSL